MARPILVEYLLKLSTDQAEYDRFRRSEAYATSSMNEAGLSEKDQKIILSGDAKKLQDAVVDELKQNWPWVPPMVTVSGPPQKACIPISFIQPLVKPSQD